MTHLFIVVAIFVLSLILIMTRPRGLPEAWAAMGGGLAMLVLGMETRREAVQTLIEGRSVLLFLLALMLLSATLATSGFFEWAALQSLRLSRGNTKALFRNVFLLGALVTAFLSLDTTAILLTPVIVSSLSRTKLAMKPFLIGCAFVANTGSLLFPVSNLTNLLFQSHFHLSFAPFALKMALPQIVAVAANYAVLTQIFRKELHGKFEMNDIPEPMSVVHDRVYFLGSIIILLCVFIGFFVGSLLKTEPYWVAFSGCAALAIFGLGRRRLEVRAVAADISWSLFPFVIGLFWIVRAVENLGLASFAAGGMRHAGSSQLGQILAAGFGSAIGTNIVNNIPMALLSISILDRLHASAATIYAAIVGCNIGPNFTVVGSLATMLVLSGAAKSNVRVTGADFFKVGLIAMPIVLLAACLSLWITGIL